MKREEDKYLLSLGHEFKTPIANLHLLLDTLYDYDLSISIKQKRDIIELGLKETRRLKELTIQFLYFRRDITSSKLDKEKVLFPSFFKRSIISYELLFFYTTSFIDFNCYSSTNPGYISIYKELYFHILVSLLGNASKFISESGWVVVENDILVSVDLSLFTYCRTSRSSVTDNGVGFIDQELLYTGFSSSNSVVSKKLGLNIIKDILSFQSSVLVGTSYPCRGTKLLFIIEIIY